MKRITLLLFFISISSLLFFIKANEFDGSWTNGSIKMYIECQGIDPIYLGIHDAEYDSEDCYGQIEVPNSGTHIINHVSKASKTKDGWNLQIITNCPKDGTNHIIELNIDNTTNLLYMTPAGNACWQLRGELKPFKRKK